MRKISESGRIGFSLATAIAVLFLAIVSQAADKPSIEIRFEHGKPASGDVVRLKQGDTVRFTWISDEAMSLHLHGYDIEVTLAPNERHETAFEAHASGRFPLTSHGSGHGHKALMYIEVYPD